MKRVMSATVLGAAMAVVLAAGCGRQDQAAGDMPPPSNGVGPSMPSNAMPPQPGADGLCNDLSPGPMVNDAMGAAAPALSGGAMGDGHYVLTKYEWYSPNQLHSRSIVLEVTGGGKYAQYLWQRDQEPLQRGTVVIATDADRIAMRGICPAGQDLEWDRYGMTDGGMTLFSTRDNKAAFFARQ